MGSANGLRTHRTGPARGLPYVDDARAEIVPLTKRRRAVEALRLGSGRLALVLAWDHNAYYDHVLLEAVPWGAARVLEVGCGAGRLAGQLAARVEQVEAIDRDAAMIAVARSTTAPDNVDYVLGDVMDYPLAAESYDAVVSMAALHHLPLRAALQRFAAVLRPGGVVVAVAHPRRDLPRELPVEFAASAWHHLLGMQLALSGYRRRPELRHDGHHAQTPVRDPQLTTRKVREQAATVLPDVKVRRLLLWRYLLVWDKPQLLPIPDRDRLQDKPTFTAAISWR
jgi:SAM-dependent methyltransferase